MWFLMRYVSLLLLVFLLSGFYFRDSTETPIIKSAAQDQMEAGAVENRVVVPKNIQYHPSASKAWVIFKGTDTVSIYSSYNVSSVTDNGVGDYTVNFSNPFSSSSYSTLCTGFHDSGNYATSCFVDDSSALTPTGVNVRTLNTSDTGDKDSEQVHVAAFGDQ